MMAQVVKIRKRFKTLWTPMIPLVAMGIIRRQITRQIGDVRQRKINRDTNIWHCARKSSPVWTEMTKV
jgi:hypothetical protein